MPLVKLLIGTLAGHVRNLPFVNAKALLEHGQAVIPTDDEILESGVEIPHDWKSTNDRFLPVGYTEVWDAGYGFDVVLSGTSTPLNTGALPNHQACVDFAQAHFAQVEAEIAAEVDARSAIEIPAGWQDLNAADMRALAKNFTESPIGTKADATAAIEAELARRDTQLAKTLPASDAPSDPAL